uniref:MADF domain-containing protein n=1 Tax=Syphacia muris TaxID=451379 RepID=A0A0N5AMM4_9BILA
MSKNLNPPGQESFNELLIKTVRLYPPLYINNRRAFENTDRSALWEEVANRIGRQVTPEFAKKRWLQLRDRYRKELKIAIAQGFTQPHRWSHFHLLSWLDPYLQGSLSVTAREFQDNVNFNGNNYSLGNGYPLTNKSFLELAANLLNSTSEQVERMEPCDSELFEDVKTPMSTMQSVLAAAEASAAKAAAVNDEKTRINELSTCMNLAEVLEQMEKNTFTVFNNEYSGLDVDEQSFSIGNTSGNSAVSSTTKASSTNEVDETPVKSKRKKWRYRLARLSRSYFLKRLRRQSRISLLKHAKRPKLYERGNSAGIELDSISPCLKCASSLMSDWFNDEEMLFARIIGLRLKKMNAEGRREARLRISRILDEEETRLNATNETVASVAE